jgi:UDP-2,3-diacylglucosamine pyrophosphatase LpxH
VSHNLLVLSDVHLGSDLVQHARPDAPERAGASRKRDRDLCALLDWYRDHRDDGRPWRLVIAGDFVDFVGMSVSTSGTLETAPTPEELVHGLGGAVDHTIAKLRLVARHHSEVFKSLAQFVAAGNTLVVVRGNHDIDLHWEPVQDEFVRCLTQHAAIDPAAIEFAPWFYYEAGVVYVEHGHQYDHFCSYDHLLHPVSPSDPRRSSRSASDVLLRYIVRPTKGLKESGHDHAGVLDYLRFGMRLGVGGMVALASRFFGAVLALFAIWRDQFTEAARWVQKEHERKMALFGEAKQISVERLWALAKLQRPPVTRSLFVILASVMLDRFVVALLSISLVAAVIVYSPSWLDAFIHCTAGMLGLSAVALLWAKRRGSLDVSADLRECAQRVAKVFPAAFVVMGHTHLPEVRPVPNADMTYVNLGAWAEEDAEDGDLPLLPATRTHLVVHQLEGRPVAKLLIWNANEGPKRFEPGFDARQSAFVAVTEKAKTTPSSS